jgi:CRISPR-associated protein Csd1
MFLQRLKEYAEQQNDLPAILYNEVTVRYLIELDEQGRPVGGGIIDLSDPDSRATRYGQEMSMPSVTRTSGISPQLLCDTAPYTLDLAREGKSAQREHSCHRAYMEMLEGCAQVTKEPTVQAVLRFLEEAPAEKLDLPEDMDRGGRITFRVGGRWPARLESVKSYWADLQTSGGAPVMTCLLCGRRRPALASLPTSVKRVPGAQPSGAAIISANENAYESYGLERSRIAPICVQCAEQTTVVLNRLLSDETHHIRFPSGVYVFWTRGGQEIDITRILTQPTAQDVRELLRSPFTGRDVGYTVQTSDFYAAYLSGNGGRVQVRDWLDTTVSHVQHSLAHWFQAQAMVGSWGESPDEADPLSVYQLAGATVRELRDLAPNVLRDLVRSALIGQSLPVVFLQQVVRRTRAEQAVRRAHAALVKLVLALQDASGVLTEEDTMSELDLSNRAPAYLCGRLLAEIEAAQRAAIPGAKATVVDRFYGAASTAPASVFGNLLRGTQAHLGKLKRDRPGAYVGIEQRMEEIMAGLEGFPRTLSLNEQALFVLGYYHQRASDRAAAIAARDARTDEA